ncbi:MAG TPA: hypothetical protein VJ896_02420 [Bacteroidales bacterium]|nr:hypothetical protein [Bacteroidales bacterium]
MLYLRLLLFAVAITAIIMVIYAIKRKQKDKTDFNIETNPEKYKKMKEEGIYNAYKQENEK